MPDDSITAEGGLIDLSGLSMHDLETCRQSTLWYELRRILEVPRDDAGTIAEWNNCT